MGPPIRVGLQDWRPATGFLEPGAPHTRYGKHRCQLIPRPQQQVAQASLGGWKPRCVYTHARSYLRSPSSFCPGLTQQGNGMSWAPVCGTASGCWDLTCGLGPR